MRLNTKFRALLRIQRRWIGTAFLCCISTPVAAAEYSPDQVKAAWMLQFLYFIDWPDQSSVESTNGPTDGSSDESNQLVLCIINDEAVYTPLSSTDGRVINNRVTSTRNINLDSSSFVGADAQAFSSEVEDTLESCRVVFFGDISASLTENMLSAFGDRAILTVSEEDEFIANGGMINFHQAGSSLLFDISMPPIDRAKLEIRSRLQSAADSVINE